MQSSWLLRLWSLQASCSSFRWPQTDVYHWDSSLSVSQGHVNISITLKRKSYQFRGVEITLMELPVTSIWKQIFENHHIREITVYGKKTAKFLRLQLRPHQKKKVPTFPSAFGFEIRIIEHPVRPPWRISSTLVPVAETWLVVWARKKGDILVWKRKTIQVYFLGSLFRKKIMNF